MKHEPGTWGGWLVEERKGRGWTQEELARRVGVAKSTVSGWETNTYPIGRGSLRKLAKALHMDAFALERRYLSFTDPEALRAYPATLQETGDDEFMSRVYILTRALDARQKERILDKLEGWVEALRG